MIFSQDHTKSQQIVNALEKDIISGKMIPGQRLLSVRAIADGFNTSVSVVDNALNALELRGLIRRKPRSGVFVNGATTEPMDLRNNVLICMPSGGHVFQELFSMIFEKLNRAGLVPMFVDYRQMLQDKPEPTLVREIHRIFNFNPRSVIIFGRNYWQNPFLERYPKVNGVFLFEVDYPGIIPGSAVLVDYEASSYAIAAHLAQQGRKRIMFCLAEPDPSSKPVQNRSLHHFSHICNGYERALRDYGLSSYTMLYTKAYGDAINEDVLAEIMASPERPDAIMCSIDYSANRFIEAAKKLDIKIPADLAITGFFNTPWSEMSSPKITTVNFNLEDMATQITEMAVRPQAERKIAYIKPEIIIKDSCGGKK